VPPFIPSRSSRGANLHQIDGPSDTRSSTPQSTRGNLEAIFSLKDNPLQTFSKANYKYEVTLQDGQVHESPPYEFTLEDTRFAWEALEDHCSRSTGTMETWISLKRC
jgi:hypothetical protein